MNSRALPYGQTTILDRMCETTTGEAIESRRKCDGRLIPGEPSPFSNEEIRERNIVGVIDPHFARLQRISLFVITRLAVCNIVSTDPINRESIIGRGNDLRKLVLRNFLQVLSVDLAMPDFGEKPPREMIRDTLIRLALGRSRCARGKIRPANSPCRHRSS